ncbi:hypothetical protein F2P81_025837 [Scophthalmus maximus]|uniref:Uncharacterized protein n=1 Tax=Scophthalmus maximus TaxID=52904 RepID=A0A6A4RRB1_SCOMX|nr:hypothetical protein F2P81_025837 [Scophthalmus maximus]
MPLLNIEYFRQGSTTLPLYSHTAPKRSGRNAWMGPTSVSRNSLSRRVKKYSSRLSGCSPEKIQTYRVVAL